MRRLLVVFVAVALWPPATATARTPDLSCGSPTHMEMVDGSYTTASTLQYDANHFVQMDAWSPDDTLQQTMDVCSWSEWDATVTETDASNPRVITYPDSEYRFTDWVDCTHSPDWSSFDHLSSTWDINSPSGGDWDESYDLFFGMTINGHDCGAFREVMVYTKWRGNIYAPSPLGNFTTPDGQNYDVYWNSTASYIQVRQTSQSTSGIVHLKQILAKLNALYTYGAGAPILGAHAKLAFIQYGPEVVSGAGTAAAGPLDFHLRDFTVTAN